MKLNKILSQQKKKESTVIPTGIASLDQMIGGLHPGHLHTIAGRPAMGCTTFVVTLARNISIMNKVPTVFFSLSLTEDIIVKRLFAAEFGWNSISREKINSLDIQIGEGQNFFSPIQHEEPILDEEMEKTKALMKKNGWDTEVNKGLEKTSIQSPQHYIQLMKEAPLWIEHNLDFTVDEILCRIERIKKNDNIQVVILDGLSWMIASQTFTERELSMQKIAQAAEKLNIAILLTSELNRAVECRGGVGRPMLGDLRGGLCAEVYSSVIMLLYRAEYYGITEDEDRNPTREMAEINVVKNVFGESGNNKLRFYKQCRFEDANESSIEEDLEDLSHTLQLLDDDLPF